jgi:NADH pyrophosphatase NudC (nudix superfamily)
MAAHKEMVEELGFDLQLKLVQKKLEKISSETIFNYSFIGEYGGVEIITQKEEVEKVRFFSKEEFEELLKTDNVEQTSAGWIREYWGIK